MFRAPLVAGNIQSAERSGETVKCRAGGWVTRARGGRRVQRATRRLWVELGCSRDTEMDRKENRNKQRLGERRKKCWTRWRWGRGRDGRSI